MKTRKPYILLVSDDQERTTAWLEALILEGFSAFACSTVKEALCAPRPEVLIADFELPDHDGLELCEALSAGIDPVATILVAEQGSLDLYRRAMKLGVHDLFPIDGDTRELALRVQAASESLYPDDAQDGFASTVNSTPTACEQVQRELAAWLLVRGIAPSTRCRIATALGDALENACVHAYPEDLGLIDVQAHLEGPELELHVYDRGEGIVSENMDHRRLQGVVGGYERMESLCEELSMNSHPNLGTHLNLRFSVHRTRFSEAECTDFEDFDFLVPDHVRGLLLDIQHPEHSEIMHLSPAIAVTVGRLLAGPQPSKTFVGEF